MKLLETFKNNTETKLNYLYNVALYKDKNLQSTVYKYFKQNSWCKFELSHK